MRKEKTKAKKIYHRMAFWIGVIILGTVVGIAVQFTRAWVEPSVTAPDGNIAAPINTGAVEQTKTGTATQRADICVDPNGDGNKICLSNGGGGGGGGSCVCRNAWCGFFGNVNFGGFQMNCGTGWENVEGWGHATGGCRTWKYTYFSCSDTISDFNPTFLVGGDHTINSCTAAEGSIELDGSNKFCKMDPRVVTNWQGTSYKCPSGWNEYKTSNITWTETVVKSCTGQLSGTCAGTSCTTSNHAWQNKSPESCDYYDGITYPGSCSWDEWGNLIGCSEDTCATDFSWYAPQTCKAEVLKIGCY